MLCSKNGLKVTKNNLCIIVSYRHQLRGNTDEVSIPLVNMARDPFSLRKKIPQHTSWRLYDTGWRTTQQSTFCFGHPGHQILIPSKMYGVTLLNNWFIETNEHQKPSKSSLFRSGRSSAGVQLLFTIYSRACHETYKLLETHKDYIQNNYNNNTLI